MVNTPLPVVAIVGRPNVGKSSLFNRLVKRRQAIVDMSIGVTRDRIYADLIYSEQPFRLIDTGGINLRGKDKISILVKEQAKAAIKEASYIFFVVEVSAGLTPLDEEIAALLRKSNKKIFLVVNKIDHKGLQQDTHEFYRLGLGKPYPISSLHGLGIDALLGDLRTNFTITPKKRVFKEAIKIAIVGRPNVGKSSFLNSLLNQERVIVADEPGTTRDAIDTYFEKDNRPYILIDTAGIRHKRKIKTTVDMFSVVRAKEAIKRCDVVLVLFDADQGVNSDDIKIVEMVIKEGKGIILVFNKWDLVKNTPTKTYEKAIVQRIKFTSFCPILFTVAKEGKNVFAALELADTIFQNNSRYLDSQELSIFFKAALERNPPPSASFGQRPKFYGINQKGIKPPTFTLIVNNKELVKPSYLNFLGNTFRQKFNLTGTPIRFEFLEKKG